jgi:hypothetical protein
VLFGVEAVTNLKYPNKLVPQDGFRFRDLDNQVVRIKGEAEKNELKGLLTSSLES